MTVMFLNLLIIKLPNECFLRNYLKPCTIVKTAPIKITAIQSHSSPVRGPQKAAPRAHLIGIVRNSSSIDPAEHQGSLFVQTGFLLAIFVDLVELLTSALTSHHIASSLTVFLSDTFINADSLSDKMRQNRLSGKL